MKRSGVFTSDALPRFVLHRLSPPRPDPRSGYTVAMELRCETIIAANIYTDARAYMYIFLYIHRYTYLNARILIAYVCKYEYIHMCI